MSLDRLRKFSVNWSEKAGEPNSKLSYGWFAGVANSFNLLILEGKISSQELAEKVSGFIDQVNSDGFGETTDIMKGKIQQADALIAQVLSQFDHPSKP